MAQCTAEGQLWQRGVGVVVRETSSFDQAAINRGFPLTRSNWDFSMAEGKEHMKVC